MFNIVIYLLQNTLRLIDLKQRNLKWIMFGSILKNEQTPKEEDLQFKKFHLKANDCY